MIDAVQHADSVAYSTIASLLTMRAEQQPCQVGYTYISDNGTVEISYAELDRRARAIGCMLADLRLSGKRAMLLYPPGIDYITAFFGCLYADATAVPVCPPDPMCPARSRSHLATVVREAKPSFVLTTAATGAILGSLSNSSPELSRLPVMTTGDVSAERSGAWGPDSVPADSIALHQYTSGSASSAGSADRAGTWLAAYRDMGLIGGIVQPLSGGFPVTMLAPADFLREPLRWLQEESAIFASAGFRREAFYPSYGLAEAMLIVSGGLTWSRPGIKSFDEKSLRYGTAPEDVPEHGAEDKTVVRLYRWVGGSRVPAHAAAQDVAREYRKIPALPLNKQLGVDRLSLG
jgi:acyl-CoA synthetase (AMP-forming)/AMP-acid ligase II